MTPAEIAALIQLAELLASKGIDAYAHMKELAAKNGITDADMAAADTEFAHAGDKLDSGTSTIGDGPAPVDPYNVDYATENDAVTAGKPGDHVYDKHDGHFRLVYGGAGGNVNPTWTLVATIA